MDEFVIGVKQVGLTGLTVNASTSRVILVLFERVSRKKFVRATFRSCANLCTPVSMISEVKGRAYRIDRRESVPSWYSGWAHLAVITGVCLLAVALLLLQIHVLVWWHLLVIPFGFVVSNLVEYLAHRYPMHRPMPYVGKYIYKKHAAIHHRYFTDKDMVLEDPRDLFEILTNPRHVVSFLTLSVLPISLVLGFFSMTAGLLFAATAISYYLFYEWVHLASHLPSDHWIPSLPVMRSLCEHHQVHHNTRLMREYNFNIAFPIFDWVFKTKHP